MFFLRRSLSFFKPQRQRFSFNSSPLKIVEVMKLVTVVVTSTKQRACASTLAHARLVRSVPLRLRKHQ